MQLYIGSGSIIDLKKPYALAIKNFYLR